MEIRNTIFFSVKIVGFYSTNYCQMTNPLDPNRALRGDRALRGRESRRTLTAPSRVVVQRDADEARGAAEDGLRRDLVAEDGDGDRDE